MTNEKTIALIAENIKNYFGASIEQGLGIVEDRLRFIRWERQIRLFDKATEILQRRGLESPDREIPIKLMLPIIEAATLEDSDSLQDRWARLLANAADSSSNIDIGRSFISILENINEYEAKLFEDLVACEMKHGPTPRDSGINVTCYPELYTSAMKKSGTAPAARELPEEIEVAINNLQRLGLLHNNTMSSQPNWVSVSALGKEFYKSCS